MHGQKNNYKHQHLKPCAASVLDDCTHCRNIHERSRLGKLADDLKDDECTDGFRPDC